MEFARQEADQHLKTSQLRGLLRQAQELMTQGSYRAVVDLLTPISEDPSAASLVFLLEDARGRLQALQRDVDGALQTVELLAVEEHYAEAIKFLEAQPPHTLEALPVQTAMQQLRAASENELAALQAVGRSYAALDRIDGVGTLQSPGVESSLLTRIVPVFTSRRKSAADRQLSSAIKQAQAAMEVGDRKQAAVALTTAQPFTEYASINLQNEWQDLLRKAKKSKMFGRTS
jgi:hypothetical protein